MGDLCRKHMAEVEPPGGAGGKSRANEHPLISDSRKMAVQVAEVFFI